MSKHSWNDSQKNIICVVISRFEAPTKVSCYSVCLSVTRLINLWPLNIEYGRYLIKLYSWFQMLEGWLLVLMVAGPLGCRGTRPRGVRVELATFYNPNLDFSCLGRRLDSYYNFTNIVKTTGHRFYRPYQCTNTRRQFALMSFIQCCTAPLESIVRMRIHIENPLKWDPDPGGIKLPTKDKKKLINVLKC